MKGRWVALSDHLYSSAPFIGLSGDAAKLHIAAYTWAGDNLSDGIVTDETVATLARMYRLKNPEAVVAELAASGLWAAATGARGRYIVTDYLELNRTRAQVEAIRQETREKVASWREKKRSNPVTSEPEHPATTLDTLSTRGVRNPVTRRSSRVQNLPGNPVTAEPVTDPPTPTPTPDLLLVSSEEGEEALDTELIDQQLDVGRRRHGANGYATEDEVHDLVAAALAEELAE